MTFSIFIHTWTTPSVSKLDRSTDIACSQSNGAFQKDIRYSAYHLHNRSISGPNRYSRQAKQRVQV